MSQPHSKAFKTRIEIYNQNQELRELAREFNQTYYTPLNSCKRNHERKKFVSNDQCVKCIELHKANYRNSEKGKIKERDYRANYVEENKVKLKAKQYGLTEEEYNQLLIDQNYKCLICEDSLDLGKNTHVDHCHKNNKVRGILCRACNVGLGHFKHDPFLMQKAATYCDEWNAI